MGKAARIKRAQAVAAVADGQPVQLSEQSRLRLHELFIRARTASELFTAFQGALQGAANSAQTIANDYNMARNSTFDAVGIPAEDAERAEINFVTGVITVTPKKEDAEKKEDPPPEQPPAET